MKKEVFGGIFSAVLAALVLLPALLPGVSWPGTVRDVLIREGFQNTGAPNLVASVYLGYRAYDTLGELVVLIAAFSSAIGLIKGIDTRPAFDDRPLPRAALLPGTGKIHTDIINVTVGKLSPVVLIFGWYLMFYGHRSPGGGFQGGVVLASGLLFIALGYTRRLTGRKDARRSPFGKDELGWVEMAAFFAILFLCFLGPLSGKAILENPLPSSSNYPAAYIIAFNVAIGLKVGSGIALTCLPMMRRKYD